MAVNSAEAMVPRTPRAVSGSTGETLPASTSIQWSTRTAPIATNVLRTGKIQMELEVVPDAIALEPGHGATIPFLRKRQPNASREQSPAEEPSAYR